ncbi:MAG: hypothetical protein KJ077_27770 [Anaerolineae bacterium]|nr:hypothetical protein [Anaerolineae bacterium]
MNKDVLLDRLLWDAEQYADEYYEGLQATSLKALLYELNNRQDRPLPPSLPPAPQQMIPVLRKHFNDDVTLISLVLSHYFPEQYFFYRVSKFESEIFAGFQFLSEIVPEFALPFPKIGRTGFEQYLDLNKALMEFSRNFWPDLAQPQLRLAYFLYEGLAPLFLKTGGYSRCWVMLSSGEYFDELDSAEKEVLWSGRKELLPGDLVFIYRTAPRSAITNILQVKDYPYLDPWGAWDGFWVKLEKIVAIADIPFRSMKQDSVIGQWGIVRRNFVGTVTEPVPPVVYNRLLEQIPATIRTKYNLNPQPVASTPSSGRFTSEADFEEKVIVPLLRDWNLHFKPQYPCPFRIGSQYYQTWIDFFVSDEAGPLTLFENKLRILNDRDLLPAVEQAKSYALLLGLPSFVVASPERMWLYSLNKNQPVLVKSATTDEIINGGQEREIKALLLNLRP